MDNQYSRKEPLEVFKSGAVTIKLWPQHSENYSYVNLSVGKLYKNEKTGKWHESRSFNSNDLVKLQTMIPQAVQAAHEHEQHLNYQREQSQQHNEQHTPQQHQPNMAAQRDAAMQQANRGPQLDQGRTQEYSPQHNHSPERSR